MKVKNYILLGASILMLTAYGPHMTKEEVIDYGEIGYSDIIVRTKKNDGQGNPDRRRLKSP